MQALLDRLDNLNYMLKISINYHRKRERYYRALDAFSKTLSLAALAAIGFKTNGVTISLAGLSGTLTIITIVMDCSHMASIHNSLAKQFIQLLSKTVHIKKDNSEFESQIDKIEHELHLAGIDEPPVLQGLVQLCQDEEDYAQGHKPKSNRLSLRRRIAVQFGFGYKPNLDA